MKAAAERVQFSLPAESYGFEPGELEVRARQFGRAQRVRRAARLAGLLLLAALISLPVPLWHLIAVPGFLVAAIWLGLRRLRQERAIEAIAGACPACGQPQQFEVAAEAQFPLTVTCPGCRAFLQLRTA